MTRKDGNFSGSAIWNLNGEELRVLALQLLTACEGMLNVGMSVRAESIIWIELQAAVNKARGPVQS